jgi:predicted TIM-barrel fold metal-dependent hydrolase
MAKKVNNKLAEAVKTYPERFAGLASIAPQDPGEAVKELERAVKELGLKGASINSHTKENTSTIRNTGAFFRRPKNWMSQSISILGAHHPI